LISRAKYDAWKDLKGMSKEEARTEFKQLAKSILIG
jgi:acyl-CoA-binding protein